MNSNDDPAAAASAVAASSSSSAAAASTAGPAAPVRTNSSSQRQRGRNRTRRPSRTDRISDILDTARDRADTMGPDPATVIRRQSTNRDVHYDDDAAVDEHTRIMSTTSMQNYQTVDSNDGTMRRRTTAQSHSQASQAQSQDQESWWKGATEKFRSVELENKGSVARDHLALERTFLAWLRTSLAFASIGIAVTQLFRLNKTLEEEDDPESTLKALGKPLGAAFLVISILILLLGFKRYFHGQEWILKGKFPASRGTIILVALVALAIMIVSLVVVIVIHPTD